MSFIDDSQVVNATDTTSAGPQAQPRDTDRVFVVLTDANGVPTGQIWQYTVAQMRLGLRLPTLYLTAAPTSATAGTEGQEARVTHDGVVDIYAYEAGAWALKIEGILLKAASSTLPKPAPNTFADFQDTQEGGSVRIVPTAGYVAADYKYAIGAGNPYQAAPIDGVIVVGDVAAAVYSYLPGTPTRPQSDTAQSRTFTKYTAPTPGNTTPNKPTFSNFNDTANTVILVPASGVPMADYRYFVGSSTVEMVVPSTGLINVGNVAGAVYAYSVAATGRNQSLTAASEAFTATVTATLPGAPVIGASTAGNATVHVTWGAPASNGGAAITAYEVYLANSSTLLGTTAGNELFYDDAAAVNGTPRSYQVLAVNSVGRGDKSAASDPVTPTAPAPVTYNTALHGPSETETATGIGLAASEGDLLEYDTFTVADSTPKRMDISIGGSFVAAVDINATALGRPFRFTPAGGAAKTGTFADGTVTL